MTGGPAAHAVGYPYDIPSSSYVLYPSSGVTDVVPTSVLAELSRDRIAVLAIGSNAAPSQLHRKFQAGKLLADPIPVVSASLRDHDVVYSGHLSRYGAVPATLAKSDGTMVEVFITFLTEAQLARMHESERLGVAYRVAELPASSIIADVDLSDTLMTYESIAGPLLLDGSPGALSAIQAENRRFPQLTEEQVLEKIGAEFQLPIEDLVAGVLNDDSLRARVETWMQGTPVT